MSKPLPDPADQVRALADEMTDRFETMMGRRAPAPVVSDRFVVLTTDPRLVVDGTSAWGPFDGPEAVTVAEALRVRFAASGVGDLVVRLVPWVAFYR